MKISTESPVQDKQSYLYQWDTQARKYFHHFEVHKTAAVEGLAKLLQNPLTRWRDPIQYRHRYHDIDILRARQLLGDISKEEVNELNRVLGGTYTFTKSYKEPAALFAYHNMGFAILGALGLGIVGYAKFMKGYNILWYSGGFAPLATFALYNWAR